MYIRYTCSVQTVPVSFIRTMEWLPPSTYMLGIYDVHRVSSVCVCVLRLRGLTCHPGSFLVKKKRNGDDFHSGKD